MPPLFGDPMLEGVTGLDYPTTIGPTYIFYFFYELPPVPPVGAGSTCT